MYEDPLVSVGIRVQDARCSQSHRKCECCWYRHHLFHSQGALFVAWPCCTVCNTLTTVAPDPAPHCHRLQGRHLVLGWVQDHRRVPSPPCLCEDYDYAGCISTPRALYLDGAGNVHQAPLPELNLLRSE